VTYHTAFGESKNIVLPDSSTVVLNSNSSLRFQNDWDTKRSREIWIEGEAFFSVAHLKSNKPFIVRTTEGLGVRVLGTSFNVYHRTRETKVVLNTGRIELQLPEKANLKQNILMQPGDLVEYKDKSFSKKRVNPEVYSAWTEQKLVLDHTSLREMVKLLQDTYGITVIVKDDSLLNQTASGSMPIKDGEGLISQIAHIFQLKSEKQKNNYVMYQ
jgi:ferric-dicitrate binding protein FerR (iron transport regulator)